MSLGLVATDSFIFRDSTYYLAIAYFDEKAIRVLFPRGTSLAAGYHRRLHARLIYRVNSLSFVFVSSINEIDEGKLVRSNNVKRRNERIS